MGGRVVASVPTSKVMDVYNAFAKIVPGTVPNKLFSTVDPLAANAAAKAFYEFKDVEGSPLSRAPRAETEELLGQHTQVEVFACTSFLLHSCGFIKEPIGAPRAPACTERAPLECTVLRGKKKKK